MVDLDMAQFESMVDLGCNLFEVSVPKNELKVA